MIGKRYTGDGKVGQVRDEQLHALLANWRGIEPRDNFETAVWRRIRAEAIPETRWGWVAGMLQEWILPHPAWATALAASVAIVVGGWAGSASDVQPRATQMHPLLQEHTLAGAYLAMSSGDIP